MIWEISVGLMLCQGLLCVGGEWVGRCCAVAWSWVLARVVREVCVVEKRLGVADDVAVV